MSQSSSEFYIRVTFGTKGRKPWIHEEIAPHLHSYIASVLKELDSPALIINSMPDHLHALIRMSKTVTIAEVMEQMKKSSSKWVKRQAFGPASFYWQRGYGAFSVSRSQVDVLTRYIANQKEHHKKMTYREEVELLMKRYEVVEYDSDFYWD